MKISSSYDPKYNEFATEKEDTMSTYEKLNCIHIALQELQNEFNIPDDNSDWYDAISLTEEIREGCRQNDYRSHR